jgi:hypothetical protein
MRWTWSRAHIERRIDRYHRLAAAATFPAQRQHYIAKARRYWALWSAVTA